uniref:Uncharacterized protein n=1 Tax=Takifugu rubripes TaxID=31033 RepID=A0A674MB70_TAKRU
LHSLKFLSKSASAVEHRQKLQAYLKSQYAHDQEYKVKPNIGMILILDKDIHQCVQYKRANSKKETEEFQHSCERHDEGTWSLPRSSSNGDRKSSGTKILKDKD